MSLSKLRYAELFCKPYTNLLLRHELATEYLYRILAESWEETRSFWLTLAAEEQKHVLLIRKLTEDVMAGKIDFHRPQMLQGDILDSIGWLNQKAERARLGGLSLRQAFDMAFQVEAYMLETRFFDFIDGDDQRVQQVLATIREDTVKHQQRLEKERARFKWKVFGSVKGKPIDAGKLPQPQEEIEDPMLNVKIAQTVILSTLSDMETALGDLYKAFSSAIPEDCDFWQKIAAQEIQHASMTTGLVKLIDKGVFRNIGRFKKEEMESVIVDAANCATMAREGKVTARSALRMALDFETSVIESSFYKSAENDTPEFKIIAERMLELSRGHVDELRKKAAGSA